MSTRSSAINLFPPLDNPELTIRRRPHSDPTLLNNSKMVAEGPGDLPVSDLRTIEELCQPSLNGRGGTFMEWRPEECYDLIENMTAHHNDWDTSAQRSESSSSITSSFDTKIPALKAEMGNNQGRNQFFQGVNQGQNQPQAYQAPAYQALVYEAQIPQPKVFTTNEFTNFMKANDAILKNMQTNMNSLTNLNLELKNMFGQFMKMNIASSSGSGPLPGNTITNQKEDLKGITTRRGTTYPGPTIPTTSFSLVIERETKATKETMHPTNNRSTEDVQSPVVLTESPTLTSEPKLPEKLGDLGKFLIPCNFLEMAECIALADLGATINLMPLSIWNKRSLPDLSPTCMTLELIDRSISRPVGVAKDVFVKVEVELMDLPPHLEYAFLEGDDKLPVIITKDLSIKEKTALITVLKSHKRAITWKLSNIKGIDPKFYTHRILMEEDFKPAVQHQRRVNPKIHDFIKQEVLKLLDAGLIYPISDSPWRCMMAIFHDMIEKTMEVFMDDFSIFENSFQSCISCLEKMLKRCEDTNLCLNWEKSYFMVKEGIVHGHKFSKEGIEVDKAKVDVITKLPHPSTVKGAMLANFPLIWNLRTIISDRATHLYNGQFTKVMQKFSDTHRLATPYHPQTSGQVEVSNRGLKSILKRTVGENHASWSDKLDDALWAFRTAYKTPIGCTPFKLVYGKACRLPTEFEHKAYWALKHANFDLQTAGDHIEVQLNELRDQAYENSLIYKEKTKRLHDSKIKDRAFNVGDRVLFNSRLKIFFGKLKYCWSGPFTISHVFSYGTFELS
uniref:Reverse transcriptase domain-containing protein n=1 Tax=Tanacetum cinerariifolium TaxID=118510 RepID=A0A6L2J0J8_TANCI|nr:reverse transcriptase domain-containing protein [Tanacetum cinerariifolium]